MTKRNVYPPKKGRNTTEISSTLEIGLISNSSLTYSYSAESDPEFKLFFKNQNVRQDMTNN